MIPRRGICPLPATLVLRERGGNAPSASTTWSPFDAALEDLLEVDGPVLVELMREPTGAGYVRASTGVGFSSRAEARTWLVVRKAVGRERLSASRRLLIRLAADN